MVDVTAAREVRARLHAPDVHAVEVQGLRPGEVADAHVASDALVDVIEVPLVRLAVTAPGERRGWLIAEVNGAPAIESVLKEAALDAGFDVTSGGLQLRVSRVAPEPTGAPADSAETAGEAVDA